MKTTPLQVGGREFRLAFTLDAMCAMEDAIEGFDISKLTDYIRHPKGLVQMVRILAEQGELLAGRTLDVDARWFGQRISPSPASVSRVQMAVLSALSDGMTMETDDGARGEEDVVLSEIKKKETTGV